MADSQFDSFGEFGPQMTGEEQQKIRIISRQDIEKKSKNNANFLMLLCYKGIGLYVLINRKMQKIKNLGLQFSMCLHIICTYSFFSTFYVALQCRNVKGNGTGSIL